MFNVKGTVDLVLLGLLPVDLPEDALAGREIHAGLQARNASYKSTDGCEYLYTCTSCLDNTQKDVSIS